MFPLHDRVRRRICVGVFLAIGLLPTVLAAAWCVWRHLPQHVAWEAHDLSRQLGLKVALEDLRHLRPDAVLYEGLDLADPETGRTVLRCPLLEAQWSTTTDPQGRCTPLVLIASQPEIEADGLGELGRMLDRIMQARTGCADPHLRLAAAEVTLRAGEDRQTLSDVQGTVDTLPGGVQADLSFRLAGLNMPEPARIRIGRNRQTAPPATGFELYTGGSALPCSTLAMGLPELGRLGSQSRFLGYLWANRMPDGWQGEITGQLIDVDLSQLLGNALPHKLSGKAQVTIQVARFRQGRLEEASGTLCAGPGTISRSLLDAAVQRLTLARGAEPSSPGDLVPYEQLALAFLIDSQGLRLQGRCPLTGPGGAVLVDRFSWLLGDPAVQTQPVVALVQALVPAGGLQVSASRQCERLMRLLPIPEAVPPAAADAAPPRAEVPAGPGAAQWK